MKNRITIIANADSFWTQRYIKNVSMPLGHKVSLITASNKNYKDFYSSNGIEVVLTHNEEGILGKRIEAILIGIRTIIATLKTKPDLVVIHYAYLYVLKILPFIQKKIGTVITYWGSDILRASKSDLLQVKKAVKNAEKIVTVTSDLETRLAEVYGEDIKKKTKVIDMGISAFDSIDLKRQNVMECKKKIVGDSNSNKTIITVGYNAGRAQQHDKILKSLVEGLPAHAKNEICFLLPMTYQKDDTIYLHEINKIANEIDVETIILSEFMNDDEIAEVCLATDVFINAQITDAMSSSMIEQIYAGSIVVNGSWLKYSFLEENDIHCVQFDSFEDLPEVIGNIIKNKEKSSQADNYSVLRKKISWEASRSKWETIYNELLR